MRKIFWQWVYLSVCQKNWGASRTNFCRDNAWHWLRKPKQDGHRADEESLTARLGLKEAVNLVHQIYRSEGFLEERHRVLRHAALDHLILSIT
jgi:hypothetical protein